ncbi:NADP oxidoreductase coenzyme F420-dependent [Ferroglobus placidus DSM 10642]|uniref:NADP oxidoreductase coenzyme F420-dependent n=1 Tax=Ferroglobus placidus (strain DSM 10642 / AEDII12DO) TaxID=589924 RepID=D3RZU9_FERPA|nr:pyrroline-5-carboxylate reductase dimerization domain-containing protein [Ferroglobus placidus]ADC66012.1 NADP oxidoreductase coenzyme F420-dependent [Ferroglobus placidus DSM 10642]
MKVAIVGGGNLGRALAKACRGVDVVIVKRRYEKIENFEVKTSLDVEADVYFIALKPKDFRSNMKKIGEVAGDKPVVSFAAGVKLEEMRKFIKNPYRAMTNIAVEDGSLIAVYPEETKKFVSFLNSEVLVCESEDELELMTSLIGSSPAFICYYLHFFTLAAIKEGVRFDKAKYVASKSFEAAAKIYMKYGLEEAVRRIATPAGTTIEGILEVVDNPLSEAIVKAAEKARRL